MRNNGGGSRIRKDSTPCERRETASEQIQSRKIGEAGAEHEQAITMIMAALKDEFKNRIKVIKKEERYRWEGSALIPDIQVHLMDGSLIVVEVGNTSAEKILFYKQDEIITEIRWYTKKTEMAFVWKRYDPADNPDIDYKSKKTLGKIAFTIIQNAHRSIDLERSRLKKNNAILGDHVYAVCPSCLKRFQLQSARLMRWNGGSTKITVCPSCKSVPYADDLDALRWAKDAAVQEYKKLLHGEHDMKELLEGKPRQY